MVRVAVIGGPLANQPVEIHRNLFKECSIIKLALPIEWSFCQTNDKGPDMETVDYIATRVSIDGKKHLCVKYLPPTVGGAS